MHTVLLVDDEPWALLGIKNSFRWEEAGLRIIGETTDASEALQIIKKKKPDVIFTDICMEKHNGIDIMRTTREMGLDSLFVVVSGHSNFSYAHEAIKYGALYYLLKPINMDEAKALTVKLTKHLKKKTRSEAEAMRHIKKIDQKVMDQGNGFGKIVAYINENFDKKITLEELSKKFFIHQTYICELFSKHLGKTYTQYVRELRMEKACQLIMNTQLPIGRIATMSGYADYFYFNKLFKKTYGMTPVQYRKQYAKPVDYV